MLTPHTFQGGGRRGSPSPPTFGFKRISRSRPLLAPTRFHGTDSYSQSVRCLIHRRRNQRGPRLPLPVFPVGGPGPPPCCKLLRASFSVSSDIIFCVISVYQSNKPRVFEMQEARSAAYFTHYTNVFGSLSHQALARDS